MHGTKHEDVGPTPGVYVHYKGGRYEVVGVARHSETLEPMVVYRALYGTNELWVRPKEMFCEDIVWEGIRQPRFQRLEGEYRA